MNALQMKNVSIRFGGLKAVSNFSLDLQEGQIHALIGPNGAGKTTIFNLITGVYQPDEGEVRIKGTSLVGRKPNEIVGLGIARTFQNIRLFKDLSVGKNVRIALDRQVPYPMWQAIFHTPHFWQREAELSSRVRKLLDLFDLHSKVFVTSSSLPYGEQRKLEIVRALATQPSVLLLDEPAAGMNAKETAELTKMIRRIRDEFELSILLIEHDMKLVMNIGEEITVLDHGEMIARGTPKEIQNNEKVIEAYLGQS